MQAKGLSVSASKEDMTHYVSQAGVTSGSFWVRGCSWGFRGLRFVCGSRNVSFAGARGFVRAANRAVHECIVALLSDGSGAWSLMSVMCTYPW